MLCGYIDRGGSPEMLIEMTDNMNTFTYEPDDLQAQAIEIGWWNLQRAQLVAFDHGGRRPLQLVGEQESADAEWVYYRGELRYADTGEQLTPPLTFNLRRGAS